MKNKKVDLSKLFAIFLAGDADGMTSKQKICKQLGLDAEASDESIMSAIKKHMAASAKADKPHDGEDGDGDDDEADSDADADANTDADDYTGKPAERDLTETPPKRKPKPAKPAAEVALAEMQTEVTSLSEQLASEKDRNKALEVRLTKIEAEKKASEVTALCDSLQADGKIYANEREAVRKKALKFGVSEVAELYKDAPVKVEMGEAGHGSRGVQDDGDKLKAAQDAIDKRVDELRKADPKMSFAEAQSMALNELPKERDLLFGESSRNVVSMNERKRAR